MDYGNRIALLRKKRHLTQEEVASLIGVTRAAYAHYERNRREPSFTILNRLSSLFQVSIDYLLERTDDPTTKPLEQQDKQLGSENSIKKDPNLLESTQVNTMDPIYARNHNILVTSPIGHKTYYWDPKKYNTKNDAQQHIYSLELSDARNLKNVKLTIDGEKLTEEELKRFIAFIRAKRED